MAGLGPEQCLRPPRFSPGRPRGSRPKGFFQMYDTGYEFIGWERLIEEWLPRLLGAALILVAGWFIGKAVSAIIRVLRS